MSTSTLTIERQSGLSGRVADYLELTKPRIGVLVLVTVAVAHVLARWGQPEPFVLMHTLLGTFLIAASASALNQWLERRTDLLMDRTSRRPLPAGRLSEVDVFCFAVICIAAGVVYTAWQVNLIAAGWGLLTWFLYVWVYTPLKSRSSANTAIGAVAGAMPILIGWSSGGEPLDLRAATLFSIVFLWQFPHFMAIAWIYRKQYRQAGMKMLTVVDPSGRRAGVQAVLGALALLPVVTLPALFLPGQQLYMVVAFLLSIAQFICAWYFCIRRDHSSARLLLFASLVYLPTVFSLLVISPLVT